jgi:hypothetical protein
MLTLRVISKTSVTHAVSNESYQLYVLRAPQSTQVTVTETLQYARFTILYNIRRELFQIILEKKGKK